LRCASRKGKRQHRQPNAGICGARSSWCPPLCGSRLPGLSRCGRFRRFAPGYAGAAVDAGRSPVLRDPRSVLGLPRPAPSATLPAAAFSRSYVGSPTSRAAPCPRTQPCCPGTASGSPCWPAATRAAAAAAQLPSQDTPCTLHKPRPAQLRSFPLWRQHLAQLPGFAGQIPFVSKG
jgi:hypothetical protein